MNFKTKLTKTAESLGYDRNKMISEIQKRELEWENERRKARAMECYRRINAWAMIDRVRNTAKMGDMGI